MVRLHKMPLGHKRKRLPKCDQNVNEIPLEIMENEKVLDSVDESETGSEKKNTEESEEPKATETDFGNLASFPILAQRNNRVNKQCVTFVIERASLEVAKVGKSYQLLDGSKHANFLRHNGRNPIDYRPDIVYSAILGILDSSLDKHGLLKALYVRTEKGVLIEIKPHVRIPRVYDRFAGLMLQLLQKLSISAVGTPEKLLRTIQNPVTLYLPSDSIKIGFSHSSERQFDIQDYVSKISSEKPLVFVVGAMAHGKIDVDYCEDFISIDTFSLSAGTCVNKICEAAYRKRGRT